MIQSFITIAFRILWRNKVTSIVNIFSLSVGITSFILIMLYIHHEMSYDKFNENYDCIYRLEGDEYAKLPPVIGDYAKDRIPEIKKVVHFAGVGKSDVIYRPERNPGDVKYTQAHVMWTDSTAFDVFTFAFIRGEAATALVNPFKVVLSEAVAEILFGETDPMGKTIEFADHQFEVSGIIRNPEKSHLEIGALVSMASLALVYPDRDLNFTGGNAWLWSATYLLATQKENDGTLEKKINKTLAEINNGNLFDTRFKHFHLRPLKEIYFFGAVQNMDYGLHGSFKTITILFVVGVFMLVLACINYINLTTARSVIRTKEVAVKRFVGSSLSMIRVQLVLESVMIAGVSLIVALTFIQIFIRTFNDIAMTSIKLAEWNRPEVWSIVLAGVITLGIVAGIYPALYLTALKPIRLMKEKTEASSSFSARSLLMTFQFTLSVMLVICALGNLQQLAYVDHADLGFDKKQVIQIMTPAEFEQEYILRKVFKEELLQLPNFLGVSYSAGSPGGSIPTAPLDFEGEQRTQEFFLVDHDYFNVMDIDLVDGRGFPQRKFNDFLGFVPDSASAQAPDKRECLVNEAFVRDFDLSSPLGKIFYAETPMGRKGFEIIGIVRDFHIRSLHHKISPMNFIQTHVPMPIANIKVEAADIQKTIKALEKTWKKVYGDRVFTFSFLDDTFDQQYKSDQQFSIIITWFTGLALVIACLGLFALSSFMITRRTKEIGIRKSMGASIRSIYTMLSWDFLKWIVVAVIIACPVAWYLMQLWLNKFAYHIELGFDIFIIAAVFAVGVGLLTVTWQSLKAAHANPIKSLRYE